MTTTRKRAASRTLILVLTLGTLLVLASVVVFLLFVLSLDPKDSPLYLTAAGVFVAVLAIVASIWVSTRPKNNSPSTGKTISVGWGIAAGLGGLALLGINFYMLSSLSAGVEARIINTSGIGVSYFVEPNLTGGKLSGLKESETVRVVCQVRNGQPITDTNQPTPQQPPMWPVWNQAVNGYYFPDIYSDLPKDPARPPEGLQECPSESQVQ